MAADTAGEAGTEADADAGTDADATSPDENTRRTDGDATSTDALPHPAFADYAAESLSGAGVGAAGKDGRLDLTFARDGDETRLVRDLARVPFHVSGTLGHDPHPAGETVYVQSPSGGVAQGDRHDISVAVGPDAVAHVTTSSATKVLSMERNYAASEVTLSVGGRGHLDYVPAPVILHPDARYAQETVVDVAPDASAVVGEVVVPGRLARGERFDFERYASTLRVRSDGDLLVADATHLAPGDDGGPGPTAPGVLDEFAVLGTLYVLAPDRDAAALADRVHDAVTAAGGTVADDAAGDVETDGAPGNSTEVAAGATHLPNGAGVLVRALGHRTGSVTDRLHAAWDAARRDLLDVGAPADRRQ
jgi:urease accessory protein